MPKQGGQGKGKPKLADRNFGKALIRRQLQGIKLVRFLYISTHYAQVNHCQQLFNSQR